MNKLVLYCKSYKNDFNRLKLLEESIEQHNKDDIPFYVSVPSVDLKEATDLLNDTTNILTDEEILSFLDINNVAQNWVTQQLVKMNFWKTGVSENYVCIDSDSQFIRDFYFSDFMYDGDTPYTVCHEQKELWNWTTGKESILGFDPKISFTNERKTVMDLFQRNGIVFDFGPSPVIWSFRVWEWLESVLTENNMTIVDAINMVPSEFTWYGESLLTSQAVRLIPREPLFKVFHYYDQYLEYKNQNTPVEYFAKNYMGIVLQSNWPQQILKY